MKVSCLPVSFFKELSKNEMSIKDWAMMGKRSGLDAVDLSIVFLRNHTPLYIREVNDSLQEADMQVTMVTTYPDLSNPDKVQRQREVEYLKHDIALASNIGAKYLRITAGQGYPETKVQEGIKWVTENFKIVDETAQKFGIKLVYENHSLPSVWRYIDFSFPTEIFLEIVSKIKDTSIRINFDTANPVAYGDDPISILEKIIDMVETIHAADTSTSGRLSHTMLGTGLVPFEEIFKYLKHNRFDGWICIEEGSCQKEPGIAKAANFVKKTWEQA